MDWFLIVVGLACIAAGWWLKSHFVSLEAKAAKAVTAATTMHTGTVVDSVLKTVGADINKAIAPTSAALTAAEPLDPAVAAALAGSVAASR